MKARQWTLKSVIYNGKPTVAIYGPELVKGEIVEVIEQESKPYKDGRGGNNPNGLNRKKASDE